MGRTKRYERDALLDAAMRVFWQRGYADTSVQQLERGPVCSDGSKGCFAINAMRELPTLPDEAAQIVADSQAAMLALLVQNISAQATRMPAKAIAEIVLTFFSGLCIEMNLSSSQAGMQRKVKHFMAMLKTL
jgi:hypothetical protein